MPLRIRSGNTAVQSLLLRTDGQTVAAGHCQETLSVNADTVGFYRAHYDGATLDANTKAFGTMPDSDRIGLLDDEWALVLSGSEALPKYLALASSMGNDLDARAWTQIAGALAQIERYERGSAGADAFTHFARSLLKPVANQLGWSTRPTDTPDVIALRATVLHALGTSGDADVIAEARRRFDLFVTDHHALAADEQSIVLDIVGNHADAATFAKLHELAKTASDQAEMTRWYSALMLVRDPALAKQAAAIAMSNEIPPQAGIVRIQLIAELADWNRQLSWETFTAHSKELLALDPTYAPLILSQKVPEFYWDALPLEELERWVRSQLPPEMAPNIARGMEAARQRVAQKALLVRQTDEYTSTLPKSGG